MSYHVLTVSQFPAHSKLSTDVSNYQKASSFSKLNHRMKGLENLNFPFAEFRSTA